MIFVITDGKQTKDRGQYESLDVASSGLKSNGVFIYALGIGKSVDREELVSTASGPDFTFQANNFQALLDLVLGVKQRICKGSLSIRIDL